MIENKTAAEHALVIAKRLTAKRLQRAWTRQTLAEKAGVNVYTLKRFERTGQISLERLIAISQTLDVFDEIERLFKPRQRIDVQNWTAEQTKVRKRGRRTAPEQEAAL